MKDVRIQRTYELPVDVRTIWPLVSDSSRLNKLLGMPPMNFRASPSSKGRPRILGTSTNLGQRSEWEEHPCEWVELQRYAIVRTYANGPFNALRAGVTVKELGPQRCSVDVELVVKPRSSLAGVMFSAMRGPIVSRWGRILQGMAAHARGTAAEIDRAVPYAPIPEVLAACEPYRRPLVDAHFPAESVQALIDFVASRPDEELDRMRPYALAGKLGLGKVDALRLFLFATRAGLLSMSWDLLCPHCRGAKQQFPSLTGVVPSSACDACGIQFDVEFDRNVEVTFSPNAAVRKLDVQVYCSGGPAVTPHVRVQQELQAQETRTLQVELRPGRYRIRASGVPGSVTLEVGMKDGLPVENEPGTNNTVEISIDPVTVSASPSSGVATTLNLKLRNLTTESTLVAVETGAWLDDAATAATVTALQDFRDLFGREVLTAGNNIRVGQVTLMFTDLKGSTALYEEVGDVVAFALVQDHFKLLANAIRDHQGAIVKTIGDAVMAVFDAPAHAVKCAIDVQRRAQTLKGHDGRDVIIKIGVHTGGCLAVELNERLDYFGNMVNVAARAQNESVGWDVVLTEPILADPHVKPLVEGIAADHFEASFKGIRNAVQLLRLWPVGRPGERASSSSEAAPGTSLPA